MKNWYIAKIVFAIVNNSLKENKQFDEQLCMIEARDEHEAFFKARMLGVKNEEEVNGENEKIIFWKFVDVPFLKPVHSFKDGMELYSCIHECDREEDYEKYVKRKAIDIQNAFERNTVTLEL